MPVRQSDTLHLTLEREPFDRIAVGKKKTEYRDNKLYWKQRLEGRQYDVVLFRNGYSKTAPEMLVEYRGLRLPRASKYGKYEIRLGHILNIKRWRAPKKVRR